MGKEVVVISLGGSQILNDGKINVNFLKRFKSIINKNKRNKIISCLSLNITHEF